LHVAPDAEFLWVMARKAILLVYIFAAVLDPSHGPSRERIYSKASQEGRKFKSSTSEL